MALLRRVAWKQIFSRRSAAIAHHQLNTYCASRRPVVEDCWSAVLWSSLHEKLPKLRPDQLQTLVEYASQNHRWTDAALASVQRELYDRLERCFAAERKEHDLLLYLEALSLTLSVSPLSEDPALSRLMEHLHSLCVPWSGVPFGKVIQQSALYCGILRCAWRYVQNHQRHPKKPQPSQEKKNTEGVLKLCQHLQKSICHLFSLQNPAIDREHPECLIPFLAVVLYIASRGLMRSYAKTIEQRLSQLLQRNSIELFQNVTPEVISEILYYSVTQPEETPGTVNLRDAMWTLLRTKRPRFSVLDDFLRTVECLHAIPYIQREADMLAYFLMEAGRFVQQLTLNPNALLYLLQSFNGAGAIRNQTFASLLPEGSPVVEQLDVFRPLTRAELFPLQTELQEAVTPQFGAGSPQNRRDAPYASPRSALGSLNDSLKRLLSSEHELLSAEQLLQVLHYCAMPSPMSKKKPKFVRLILRRLRPHVITFTPEQMLDFAESAFSSIERCVKQLPPVKPIFSWRSVLRSSPPASAAAQGTFDILLAEITDQLQSRIRQDVHNMLHHLTPPDVSGSTLLPNADVSQTSFFKTPLLLVRATYILRLLNIPDTDIGGFVAQRLLADNARWIKSNLNGDQSSLTILANYFEMVKNHVARRSDAVSPTLQEKAQTLLDTLEEPQRKNEDFCSVNSVPLRIVVVNDILQDILSSTNCDV